MKKHYIYITEEGYVGNILTPKEVKDLGGRDLALKACCNLSDEADLEFARGHLYEFEGTDNDLRQECEGIDEDYRNEF